MCIPGTCECSLFWWLNPTKQGLFIVYLTVLVYFDIFGYLRLLVGIPVLIILQTYRHDTLYIYIHTTPLEMAQADPQTK